MFIEVAVASMGDALVTGNLRQFPPGQRHGIRVLTPRAWLDLWADKRGH
ncbi:MAG: hypothetical protein ABSD47_17635 [Candidatus Methylomirabilota bacterium]|jgi:hypothetical protein